jgi:hypothetical protein
LCIPNLNILLTLSGALLGTIVNVYFPVFFYLRAFNESEKNKNFEIKGLKEGEPKSRACVKFFAYVIVVVGTIIGIWGIVYCVIEISNGVGNDEV